MALTPKLPDEKRKDKAVSWRLTPPEFDKLQPFFDAFPGKARMADSMRWLMSQPEVKTLMRDKVRESRRRR